jgi:hypothetical protein
MSRLFLALLPICPGLIYHSRHVYDLCCPVPLCPSISSACHLAGMDACHTSRHVYDLCYPAKIGPSVSSACQHAGMDACHTSRHLYDLCSPAKIGPSVSSACQHAGMDACHTSRHVMIFAVQPGLALQPVQPSSCWHGRTSHLQTCL